MTAKLARDVSSIIAPHSAFTMGLRRLEGCFALAGRQSTCIAVIGESRTGKSSVLDAFCENHPAARLSDGLITPVVRVDVPSKPTVKGLCEAILGALGAEDGSRGTEQEKTRRIKVLWTKCKCKALLLDEFQHFWDKTSHLVQHYAADWLKIFSNDRELRCALVVAGLSSCQAVIDQNEQLTGRFLAPIELSRFTWGNEGQRREFKSILCMFNNELKKEFDLPEFHSDDMAFRWWCATGGLLGYLANILQQAASDAVADERTTITLADLHNAHTSAVWHANRPETPRPFRHDFMAVETAELDQRVAMIGVAVEPPPMPRKKAHARSQLAAAQVLVAK